MFHGRRSLSFSGASPTFAPMIVAVWCVRIRSSATTRSPLTAKGLSNRVGLRDSVFVERWIGTTELIVSVEGCLSVSDNV